MRTLIDGLRADTDRARGVLTEAERAGMEVSQARFDLNGAQDALVKARAAVHAFRLDAVQRETDPGMAISARAYARGVKALQDLQVRRKGLAVSVVIILALIGGLMVKIRQLERHPLPPGEPTGRHDD
jgi:hypothetical protein